MASTTRRDEAPVKTDEIKTESVPSTTAEDGSDKRRSVRGGSRKSAPQTSQPAASTGPVQGAPDHERSGPGGGPHPDQWEAWVQHLGRRKRPKPLAPRIAASLPKAARAFLHWFPPEDSATDTSRDVSEGGNNLEGQDREELFQQLERVARGKPVESERLVRELESWLSTCRARTADARLGWEAIAWCHAAPRLALWAPAALWRELLDCLLDLVRQARAAAADFDVLSHQLLAAELPLTLAALFPELDRCRELQESARIDLSRGICDSLDGEGLPQAADLNCLRPLLASWTRCHYLASDQFDDEAQIQWEWMIRQALRLCRHDGTQVLTDERSGRWSPGLFAAMLQRTGDASDWAAAEQFLPSLRDKKSRAEPPDPTVYSSWSELAILRSGWSRGAIQLALRFDHPRMSVELSASRTRLLAGVWEAEYQLDGDSLEDLTCWEEVCWYSDDDIDYLELERPLAGGFRVQRQIALAKQDEFLFLADALLGERAGELACRWTLPLGTNVHCEPAAATRELQWNTHRGIGRLLPLSLPEWRVERASGDLRGDDASLCSESQGRGTRLLHPLFVDLSKRRVRKPLTWRRLTVAEQRTIQSPDVAVGYRVQVGKQQWLIYRSLAPAGNRTLLGQNTSHDFVLARFLPNGTCDPLIEIEAE